MITDEDYEKYIRIHMPNIRKLTLEHTVKIVNEVGEISMSQQANEVFGLRILPDPKGCEIDVRYTEYTGDKNSYSFVLPANNFDKWNRDIDNNNIGDQRYGAVLIEISRVENRETQSGLIRHHETVYKSTKLILNK